MSREDIEEAIEVLEDASADMLMETGDKNYYVEAIAILRQALETEQQPEQEPLWSAEECERVIKTLRYIQGIAERGEGRAMRDDETLEQFVLGYVKKLEQQEQEPVAWRTFDGEGGYDYRSYEMNETYDKEWAERNPNHKGWVEPLYTAPSKKEWVGLTDEEIAQGPQEVLPALYGRWGWAEKEAFEAVVAWAEAKLKEKNGG